MKPKLTIFTTDNFLEYKSPHPQHVAYSEMAKIANKVLYNYIKSLPAVFGTLKFTKHGKQFQ